MSDGVLIKYDELDRVNERLKKIIEELEDASGRSDDLEGWIDTPYGKNKLRDRASEFESGWDDRRNKLLEDIQKVQQHVDGVLKGFEEWDTDTASEMDSAS